MGFRMCWSWWKLAGVLVGVLCLRESPVSLRIVRRLGSLVHLRVHGAWLDYLRQVWCFAIVCQLDDGGHTLVCGGGSGGGVGSTWDAAGGRGWMSQWNLATRTAIRGTSLPAEIQCITPSDDGHTLAIGSAESVVNYFNRSRLERRARTPVTPKTVYSLGISNGAQNSGVTCVAGSGPWINICTLPGIVAFSLYFV